MEVLRYNWDDVLGTVLPNSVRNHTMDYARHNEWDRLLIHYLQTYVPFRADASRERTKDSRMFGEAEDGRDVWDRICEGDEDAEEVQTGIVTTGRGVG